MPPFGQVLRQWRQRRNYSQLALALDAQISQKHLSFLESGSANPSREMVLLLSEALKIPNRDRNELLLSAGFAPLYQEHELESSAMDAVREALNLVLKHHEPFPALVVDENWNMLHCNASADRFLSLLGGGGEALWNKVDPSGKKNVMRMTFHPNGLQPILKNWPQLAALLLFRLQREISLNPANAALTSLLQELMKFPHVPTDWKNQEQLLNTMPPPVFPFEAEIGGLQLKLFSIISAFGTAIDVTANDIRIETFFPADEFTEKFFASLQQGY